MKIVFDSTAIFDEKCQAVKFAGRIIDSHGVGRFVICQVPRAVLVKRFKLREPGAQTLLECYGAAKAEIDALAVKKAKLGDYRPVITAEEFCDGR
ncbi:MAG: hypothetical protein JF627_03420 [Alphaproteobacteria bacterium]|nr:hypothetical protein [Alphaproteobacteria bacterium]